MNPTFTWFTIGSEETKRGLCCGTGHQPKKHVIDIMGALTQDRGEFLHWLNNVYTKDTVISLGGELKCKEDGKPPSNFRSKDKELNENVVHNLQALIMKTKSTGKQSSIFVNTIPRNKRLLSFNIGESGSFKVRVDPKFTLYTEEYIKKTLHEFLGKFGIGTEQLLKVRESCKGAKYNTYLVDMISFLYQIVNVKTEGGKYFETEFRIPVVNSVSGYPSEIYMDKVTDTSNAYEFMVPKDESIENIYIDFVEAISEYDNPVKRAIRHYVNTHYVYRWTDFDVNDTDDAFTILMILYAYRCKPERLTKNEDKIVKSMEEQMEFWFDQL